MKTWLGLLLAAGASGVLRADNLTLTGEACLSGTVRSINEAGVVELASPLSPEPVLLKAGAVTKVEFSAPESPPNPPGSLIELTNGDLLPATVESLDEKNLNVVTTDAGRLSIPRTSLKSMQFGVQQRRIIYSGPRSENDWAFDKGTPGWRFEKDALATNVPARISKNFELPARFILKFTLKWQANPVFKIDFADPLAPEARAADRYYLQFNSSGLEIKRESSVGKRYHSVIILQRTPDEFAANQLDVEIRVDRKTSRLHLFLNGEPEGAGVDPVGKAPLGNGITLTSQSPAGFTQEIRGIEISELDNARVRHRSEDRGDPKTDSLISRDEDRWGGRLTSIRQGPEGAVLSFKSDFQETPLELAEADVSTIFFATPAPAAAPGRIHPFALRLRGGGMLRVSACTFSEAGVTATHPLLGALKINRAGISALERTDAAATSKPAAKPEE